METLSSAKLTLQDGFVDSKLQSWLSKTAKQHRRSYFGSIMFVIDNSYVVSFPRYLIKSTVIEPKSIIVRSIAEFSRT